MDFWLFVESARIIIRLLQIYMESPTNKKGLNSKRSLFGRRSEIPPAKVTSSWYVNLFGAMYYIYLIVFFRRRYIYINPINSTGRGWVNFFEKVVDTHCSCVDVISRVARVIARSNERNYQVELFRGWMWLTHYYYCACDPTMCSMIINVHETRGHLVLKSK